MAVTLNGNSITWNNGSVSSYTMSSPQLYPVQSHLWVDNATHLTDNGSIPLINPSGPATSLHPMAISSICGGNFQGYTGWAANGYFYREYYYFYPFHVGMDSTNTVDVTHISFIRPYSAAGAIDFAIYNTQTGGWPYQMQGQSFSIAGSASSSTPLIISVGTTITLTPGWYWLCLHPNHSSFVYIIFPVDFSFPSTPGGPVSAYRTLPTKSLSATMGSINYAQAPSGTGIMTDAFNGLNSALPSSISTADLSNNNLDGSYVGQSSSAAVKSHAGTPLITICSETYGPAFNY